MNQQRNAIIVAAALAAVTVSCAPHHARVGVYADVPGPPSIAFETDPYLVPLPGTYVYAAPDYDVDLYYADGYYWRPWQGRWYRSSYYDRGWAVYSGVPRFYSSIPRNWRNEYYSNRWRGRSWQYARVPHHEVERNWSNWKRARRWDADQRRYTGDRRWIDDGRRVERSDRDRRTGDQRYDRSDYDRRDSDRWTWEQRDRDYDRRDVDYDRRDTDRRDYGDRSRTDYDRTRTEYDRTRTYDRTEPQRREVDRRVYESREVDRRESDGFQPAERRTYDAERRTYDTRQPVERRYDTRQPVQTREPAPIRREVGPRPVVHERRTTEERIDPGTRGQGQRREVTPPGRGQVRKDENRDGIDDSLQQRGR